MAGPDERTVDESVPRPDTVPDLVVVGAASRDRAADDRRGWRLGGTATYASLAAARLGVRVGCLLGLDDLAAGAAELLILEEAGVMLQRVRLAHGPAFDNIEADGHRRQRWMSPSDLIDPVALPAEWQSAGAWLLGPVAGELDPEWAAVPGPSARVCLGWQGLLRRFAPDGWVERIAPAESLLLERAGLVCASLDDVALAGALDDLRSLAPAATIVLTAGAAGGLVLSGADGKVSGRYRAIPANPRDPTGAGDVFMAALVAAWTLTGQLATPGALRLAAAAASCVLEGPGLAGVPTRQEVVARARRG